MSSMTLFKRFMKYALPSITSMVVFSLYTIVDGIIVSWGVGEEALAAVNLSTPFNSLVFSIGVLLAAGTSVVTAIFLGRGEEEEANRCFNQNLAVTVLVALVISAAVLFQLPRVALFLGAGEHTFRYVKEYVGTIAVFAVFFMVSYNLEVLVKTSGAPQISVVGVVSSAVTNTVLDMAFVFVFHWGVLGAAIATGLAQVVSTVIFIVYFLKKKGKLTFGKFSWNLGLYRRILPIGVADGITELSNGAVIFLYNQTILRLLGEDGIVSYTVISYVNTLVLMMVSGTAQGLLPISSFYHGKGEEHTGRRLYRMALLVAVVIGAAGFAVCQLGGSAVTGLFLEHDSHLFAPTVRALRAYSPVFLLMGLNIVTGAYFASMERSAYSSSISVGRGLLFPIAAIALIPAVLGGGGIWISMTVSEFSCLTLTAAFFTVYRRSVARRDDRSDRKNEKDLKSGWKDTLECGKMEQD